MDLDWQITWKHPVHIDKDLVGYYFQPVGTRFLKCCDIPRYSAGNTEHKWTSLAAMDNIFSDMDHAFSDMDHTFSDSDCVKW